MRQQDICRCLQQKSSNAMLQPPISTDVSTAVEPSGDSTFLKRACVTTFVYATQQCARLSEYPRESHGGTVKNLFRYLAVTKNDRLILDTEKKEAWKFMQISILVDTGIIQHLPKMSELQKCVRAAQLCNWDTQS